MAGDGSSAGSAARTAEIAALVSGGMRAELHWFPEDVIPGRLAAVLVGMANGSGGTVLIGLAPRSGQIQGLRQPQEALGRVFQAAVLADPPLVLPAPQLVGSGPVQVVWISVPAGLSQVYSLEGRFLGREGSQTNPLAARRLRELLVERGALQFEAQAPPEASLEDLDLARVEAYGARLGLPLGNESPQEILLRRGCARRIGGQLRPTYAGLLLFGRYPQQWLPGSIVLAARFAGETLTDSFIKQEISGTLPDQLIQAEAFVRANLRQAVRLVGLARQETSEYPLEAVRELLVNAVAHRDYNLQGDSIHLNLFADRLEIHSPGGLPGPVTLDNLLEARFSRNPVVVQVLSDLGYVERLGYGLDRVMAAMRSHALRPPRFEENGGAFRVTLFGENESAAPEFGLDGLDGLDLNPRQQAALAYLARRRRISSGDFQELCPEVHPETLRRDLTDLARRGLVIKVGDKRATYYILKK